jgi:hypothetical protein
VAGRFPLYTDADVRGPLIKALRKLGWDIVRAVDTYPEKTVDPVHFERAVEMGRVLVSHDEGQQLRAVSWHAEGRALPGLITWRQDIYNLMSPGGISL